jgi:ornithine carbamoyltransferase
LTKGKATSLKELSLNQFSRIAKVEEKTSKGYRRMTRSFVSFSDLSSEELMIILGRIRDLKVAISNRERIETLDKVVIGLLFEKPSTRTSAGFEVATIRLGGQPLYFSSHDLQLSRGEPVKDTARVLGSDLDGIVARVFSHSTVVDLAEYSHIPVINGLSDLEHPTQVVGDLFTILEVKGKLEGLKLAYVGDGNNVCNSLLLGAAATGMDMSVACPKGYEPNGDILSRARANAKAAGSSFSITDTPKIAAKDADILYTDVWVSMGEEAESAARMKAFNGFQINSDLLKVAKQDAVVMHCLPAHRGLEITDDVIDGKQSIVWQQAENKLHGAAGILEFFLKAKNA